MGPTVDLVADLSEGFGAYSIGDDKALLDVVSSANIGNLVATRSDCGIHDAVPTYDSLLVEFGPYLASARQIHAVVLLGMRLLDYIGAPAGSPMGIGADARRPGLPTAGNS
jgi:hypothetical protein